VDGVEQVGSWWIGVDAIVADAVNVCVCVSEYRREVQYPRSFAKEGEVCR
jgi:hypothetical protein